ncbi:MAG: nucleoside hydrolase [Acidobacteria bacterium]|nr:nucleoside hydrolase [Acidobacteriota bacterium]
MKSETVYIDTDNALGSPLGDVDDAYALVAALRGDLPINAIGTVFGNTSERRSFENTTRLLKALGLDIPVLRGAARAGENETEAAAHLSSFHPPATTILALGPLTNLVRTAHLPWREMVVVGANASSRGRWPPWHPHEFNLTKDREATLRIFDSGAPLTFFPLDRLESLRISFSRIRSFTGEIGNLLGRGSWRWLVRGFFVKWRPSFRVCDLIAAMYLVSPELYEMEDTVATIRPNTHVSFGEGTRPVRVLRSYDAEKIWSRFLDLVNQ